MKKNQHLTCLIFFMLVTIFLSACNGSGGPPKDLVSYIAGLRTAVGTNQEYPTDKFKVVDSYKYPLSAADKTNGVEGRWCVAFTYIFQGGLSGEPVEGGEAYTFSKVNGVWNYDLNVAVNKPWGVMEGTDVNCDWARP